MAEELGKGLQNPVHECESRPRLHGQVAELVYAADLKSVAARLEGSSPSLPTRKNSTDVEFFHETKLYSIVWRSSRIIQFATL